jgi:LPXTG-motif cell wall-anchored protein
MTINIADPGTSFAATPTVRTLNLGPTPYALANDTTTDTLYAACIASSTTVSVINGATNQVDHIHVGSSVGNMAMDPTTDTLYAEDEPFLGVSATTAPKPNGYSLLAIDGKTYRVIHAIHIGSAAFGSIAVDPATNTIYASGTSSMSVSVLNGGTGAVISSIRLGKEHIFGLGLAIDPNTNTLYLQGFRSLVVVDLANQNHRALSLNSSWFTVAGIVVVAGGSLFIARMRRRRPSAS